MQGNSEEHHFAHAARRHYEDADYLLKGTRLSNADHHYGFAVECALKSLLLRFTAVTMDPVKPGGQRAKKPYLPNPNPATNKPARQYGHLPWVATDVALLTHGRSASPLTTALGGLSAFASWSEQHRYLDGSEVVEADVRQRRTVAQNILALHEQALITGRLP
ncbi:hypothetical protein [Streptomyces sp. B93]|uniref:hypothetical protein n=1 Tax=Streptomyces sp. B93 TaxID=2824875 RepID=UPI001B37D27C|nr:hypothetical protein [Streptomyces sp. B93]MBQ1090129.1 hypothetical protein [Streptomyces sp. B93]